MKNLYFFCLFCLLSLQQGFANPIDTITGLTCPPGISISLQGAVCDTVLNYNLSYSSEDPAAALTQLSGLPPGSVFPQGTTVNTFQLTTTDDTLQCSFSVTVSNPNQEYYIRFPDDVLWTSCPASPFDYGMPVTFSQGCPLISVSYEDALITVVPDACFRIERTWTVVNLNTYNPAEGLVHVPNPNPHPNSNNAANLTGPVVSPIQTGGDPWQSTFVKIVPTDQAPTNYSIYWNPVANGYKYRQIIRIVDMQDPVAVNHPAGPLQFGDLTDNDSDFWNAPFYWDPVLNIHDKPETPVDLFIQGKDDCTGPNVTTNFRLFLDLDNDGTMETVVDSRQLPPADTLYVGNNDGDADLQDGTPRNFDFRPVPNAEKWQFARVDSFSTGGLKTFLRWKSIVNNQTVYGLPHLPHGVHKIRWEIADHCGNDQVYENPIHVNDKKAPVVVCINGLSVNIMPTQLIQLWATDFLAYAEDNNTPGNQIRIGIRKSGTGTGFPVDGNGNPINSVIFDCDDLGTQFVELWAIDQAGNAGYCETYVVVQDNMGFCSGMAGDRGGKIKDEGNCSLEQIEVDLISSNPAVPPVGFPFVIVANGGYTLSDQVPYSDNLFIVPSYDVDPLNGVSTYDLVLISRHILGFEPLNSPYKIIAGDASRNGSLTAFDIVELRRLILGIYQELPNNSSWRFVEKAFVFPNPINPFQSPVPTQIPTSKFLDPSYSGDFVAVKVGDVNSSAQCNQFGGISDEAFTQLKSENLQFEKGEIFEAPFSCSEDIWGCQFTLDFQGLELLDVLPGEGLSIENFGVFKEEMSFSTEKAGSFDFKLRFRATQAGSILEKLRLGDHKTANESYLNLAGERRRVKLWYEQEQELKLFRSNPNPSSGQTQIAFYLPENQQVQLRLIDASGKIVWEKREQYAAGYQQEMLQLGSDIPTGAYTLQLITAKGALNQKLLKI